MAFASNAAQTNGGAVKPLLNFWQIWNISFGFLGVQIGYSLQNANTSRILSAIGADPHHLSLFWLAAPVAGLIVQPIVGLSSDKTWTKLGRRIPFILGGAFVSAGAMFFMPNSENFAALLAPLFFGATMLLLMDTSFNVTMQPFRALVSDMVPDSQRNKGYSIQSFLINAGAVLGSLLPFILTWLGVANEPGEGKKVAPTVIWSFYIGGAALLLTVLWTSFRTKEYPPEEYKKYNNIQESAGPSKSFGQLVVSMPRAMMELAVTQFFSWFALFLMWVYTTSAIAGSIWNSTDPTSKEYNEAGNWTGVIFAAYSLFAALYSLVLPGLAEKLGRRNTYALSLIAGGIGLVSIMFIKDKNLLFLPMVGIGMSWAAILAMPYAILSSSLPPEKTGVYMGIFNATITIPQIVAGFFGGMILLALGGEGVYIIALSGASMLLAGIFAKLVISSEGK
ncbi:MAG: MFS transporter [Chitinophagaceae bacterium]|jgi:maltose/moltooligosaccharide transporter|nr:MFS transporter [Chitinophagaceae bacterium]